MRYSVPASKIVFTDFMILLVSVLMGLNSVMSFEEQEGRLPAVTLPKVGQTNAPGGMTQVRQPTVTVKPEKGGLAYYYHDTPVTLAELGDRLRQANATGVMLRGDRETPFQWEGFCRLTALLRDAGVKEIHYAVMPKGGENP
jgi:biopolymer transport protein ExbD